MAEVAPDETHHLIVAEGAFGQACPWRLVHPDALRSHFLGLVYSGRELELSGLVDAGDGHSVDHPFGAELAVLEIEEVALGNPGLTLVAAFVILIRSKVDGRLCLDVAGTEDRTADHASPNPRNFAQRILPLDSRVHSIAVSVLLYPAVAGLVGHTVDLASCRLPGAHLHSHHLVFRVRSAAVGDFLARNLAVHNLVGGILDRTVRVRSRCLHHGRRNIGQTAGSYHIRNRHIHHVAGGVGRSPGRGSDRSRDIAAAEGSRRSVFAPEPAGAGRSKLDEELGRKMIGRTPCCRSNGRRSGVIARVSESRPTRRASFNGFNAGVYFKMKVRDQA